MTALLALVSCGGAHGQTRTHRQLDQLAASRSGSAIVAAINDDAAPGKSLVVLLSPATGKPVWQSPQAFTVGSVAITSDGNMVAVGLVGVADRDLGVLLLDARTGKQIGGLGVDLDRYFMPGQVFPRFGSGVSQLQFSSDGSLLYGLSNDTLFAWDMAAKHYLWTVDVPASIQGPPDQPDALPYGHTTTFVLSSDGRQIAAVRDVLRIATAGRIKPAHFIRRAAAAGMTIEGVDFSPDGKTLAAGETDASGSAPAYASELWLNGAVRPVRVPDCGGGLVWSDAPELFGCQNGSGAHLRSVNDAGKDIGAAGAPSDLPILKVGHSLWSAAYLRTDWSDPSKPFPLTLSEIGSGKRVTVTLPGR